MSVTQTDVHALAQVDVHALVPEEPRPASKSDGCISRMQQNALES